MRRCKNSLILLGSIFVLVLFWQWRNISLYGQTVKLPQKKRIPDDNNGFHGIKNNTDKVKTTVFSQKAKLKFDDRQNNSVKQNNRTSGIVTGKLFNKKEHILLVMWSHPWGVKSEGPKEGWKSGNCSFTYKRDFLEEADAVIFHWTPLPRKWSLPR